MPKHIYFELIEKGYRLIYANKLKTEVILRYPKSRFIPFRRSGQKPFHNAQSIRLKTVQSRSVVQAQNRFIPNRPGRVKGLFTAKRKKRSI